MEPYVKIIFAVVLLGFAAAGAWLANTVLTPKTAATAPEASIPLERGTRLTPPHALPAFSLVSHTGEPLRREQLAGRWTLMFFGFTHCPGVCPMTLATLSDTVRRIERQGAEKPQIAFVSVDPERDTPAVMAEYIKTYDAPILGLTGERAGVDAFAAALGIAHSKIPMDGADYMVDHTSVVILLDKQARQAAVFWPFEAGALANDYLRMLGRTP